MPAAGCSGEPAELRLAEDAVALREELRGKGVSIPQGEELAALSKRFNAWLEAKRMRDEHQGPSQSWFALWRLLDDDGSELKCRKCKGHGLK